MREHSPSLADGEQDWFAAGMHQSPFAAPLRKARQGQEGLRWQLSGGVAGEAPAAK